MLAACARRSIATTESATSWPRRSPSWPPASRGGWGGAAPRVSDHRW